MKNSLAKALSLKNTSETAWVLALALVFGGLFYEILSVFCSVALCVLIIIKAVKQKSIKIYLNPLAFSVGLIFLFYILSVFWAADSGMAPFGAVKFLPLPLFLLLLMQQNNDKCSLALLPPIAAFTTVLSAIFAQIPPLKPYFLVNGRLAGFFQYPNTFALLLLCALIYTLFKEKLTLIDIIYILIFVFGILYSGSRTVFILTVVSVILIVFKKIKKTKNKLIALISIAGVLLLVALVSVLGGFTDSIGRFLTTSLSSSTFLGRFLYFADALPVILKNPFGLGYLGYYSVEQAIQSGLYSVRFIHNDFLQLFLDVGWLPTIAFIFAVVKSFFKKGTDFKTRLLIFVIAAHSCFDFNLQFVFMFMLFLAVLNNNEGKEINIKKSGIISASAIALTVISIYFGVAQGFYFAGNYASAQQIYPNYTEAKIKILANTDNTEDVYAISAEILKLNKHNSLAESAQANYFFAKGDVKNAIAKMESAINKAPFSYAEYEKTAYILQVAINLYENAGDKISADYCKNKLISLSDSLHSLEDRLSPLGGRIVDKPTTKFPNQLEEYIEGLKNEN